MYCVLIALQGLATGLAHRWSAGALRGISHEGETVRLTTMVRDGAMLHRLQILEDRMSGVVRLEASASRGPLQDVPIWTAFVTMYVGNPKWAKLDDDGFRVQLVTVQPPAYVFCSDYEVPLHEDGGMLLRFISQRGRLWLSWTGLKMRSWLTLLLTDASGFVAEWKWPSSRFRKSLESSV